MRAHEFVTEGREEFNWELMQPGFEFEQEIAGVTYKVTNDSGQLIVTAWAPSRKKIGHAVFWKHQTRSGLESLSTEVDPAWQGKGIAANMYSVVRMLGANINPSLFQTRQGKHMWNKWRQQGDVAQLKNMNAKIKEQGVAEGVNDYLWHGSKSEHEILYPQQANDTGGKEESNKNAVYATPSAKTAIAMGLTTPESDTGMFPNDPQMVLFSGNIRKGQMVYLHKVPKDLFIKHNSREWYSKPGVEAVKPIEVVKVPVDQWLHLIRQATPQDLELRKKYMKEGVAEGKIKLSTDPNWYGAEVGDYKASGPIVNIPTNRLVGFEPDDKMNQPASKANVEKIVDGLKQGAKLPPLMVRQYKNGYQVLDGHHRFWAYKLLGVKSISAQVVPAEDIEEITKQGVAENFADGKVKGRPGMAAALTETFDQPYPMTWEHGEESHDALIKLPDGTNLSIMFSMDYGAYGDEEWTVEFWRNNSQEATGEGDQQRVFATVLSAIQQFIKTEHPERIRFSANKDVEQGQKSQTRSNLYTKLVQRYANSWGYGVDVDDFADTTVYNLHTLNENFADGKVKGKSRPGRVKRAGASCSGSVTDLRRKAKNASGERAKMYHWCANMKSGRKK